MFEVLGAIAATGLSLIMPAPVVSVASDGPWVAIAEGRSAYDCDRVSIWNTYPSAKPKPKVFRLGRKTSCTTPGHRIAALSEIDNRAVWLHVAGEATRTWTLWTATTTSSSPKLLARVVTDADDPPPIVLGNGNKNRAQWSRDFGLDDVLPYAIGNELTVLDTEGKRQLRWTAPSRVTALTSAPSLLAVALADGTVAFWASDSEDNHQWHEYASYSGPGPATRLAWHGGTAYAQRDGRLDALHNETDGFVSCRVLAPGERLLGEGSVFVVLGTRRTFEARRGCNTAPFLRGEATTLAVDYQRLTYAFGRRVTTDFVAYDR